jgi:hypothetical protein
MSLDACTSKINYICFSECFLVIIFNDLTSDIWLIIRQAKMCIFLLLVSRQPYAHSSRLRRVRPLWVLCTQPFLAFLQEAVSRT